MNSDQPAINAVRDRLANQPVPSHVERMQIEAIELSSKIEKLSAFLGTPTYKALPVNDQVLLIAQHQAMSTYRTILGLRTTLASQKPRLDHYVPDVVVPPHDDMVAFIGTKIINAKPMIRGVYCQMRGWNIPADEDANDAGYLVEYTDAQRPNVEGFAGFVSWSPKAVFEAAYNEYRTTARQDDAAGEILSDGVRLKKPYNNEPIPFD